MQRNNTSDIETSAEQTNKTLKRKQNGAHKANVKKKSVASDSDSDDSVADYVNKISDSEVTDKVVEPKQKRGAAVKAKEKQEQKSICISSDNDSSD